jgi:hypothetical protein
VRQPRCRRHKRQQSKRSNHRYRSVSIPFTQRKPHLLLDGSVNHSVYASGSQPDKPPQVDGPRKGNIADTTTQATVFRRISNAFRCSKIAIRSLTRRRQGASKRLSFRTLLRSAQTLPSRLLLARASHKL